jgi:hypothetical protein
VPSAGGFLLGTFPLGHSIRSRSKGTTVGAGPDRAEPCGDTRGTHVRIGRVRAFSHSNSVLFYERMHGPIHPAYAPLVQGLDMNGLVA